MDILLFLSMCALALGHAAWHWRRPASTRLRSVDAIVPAFNEGPCLEASLRMLLCNPYIARVVCVNDGSTDETAAVLDRMVPEWEGRLVAVHQANTGKGGALMHGLRYATAPQVFLSDADTYVPPDGRALGYLLAEIEAGADAVGGIPSSDLRRAGVLPHIRATVKLPMIFVKRTLQQLLGGAPFLVSGACGMFRTDVLRRHGFTDRTKVEDLDLTWTLVANGFKVRQAGRCVVYTQECNTLREEWRRWRRWIIGYAVCMRLHRGLLLSRYGVMTILPMVWVVLFGVAAYAHLWSAAMLRGTPLHIALTLFPLWWLAVVGVIGTISAVHHRKPVLVPLAALAVLYVVMSYALWLLHGTRGLLTGREPSRDKPTRYTHVVG